MFGISEEHILEQSQESGPLMTSTDAIATLSYNQTEYRLIRDGVDIIKIFDDVSSSDRYRVEYWGYLTGTLRITREGLVELLDSSLTNEHEVPYWTLELEDEDEERPWWVPNSYEFNQTVECEGCGQTIGVRDVYTDGPRSSDNSYYCRDCIETEQ